MPEMFHRKLERSAILFVLGIIAAASVGGIVEIAPLFTIDETVEDAPDMRVYTPLELAGRNIYVREGCYACHSQMTDISNNLASYSYNCSMYVKCRDCNRIGNARSLGECLAVRQGRHCSAGFG